jgi:hypothetical protein
MRILKKTNNNASTDQNVTRTSKHRSLSFNLTGDFCTKWFEHENCIIREFAWVRRTLSGSFDEIGHL